MRPPPPPGPAGRGTAESFVQKALAQRGDRYIFGTETNLNDPNPKAFDCSELVQWAAHQAGVSVPDGTMNQLPYFDSAKRWCRSWCGCTGAGGERDRLLGRGGHHLHRASAPPPIH